MMGMCVNNVCGDHISLQVQVDPDMSSPLRKMQTVEPWAISGVAVATDAASVPHLLARWVSVDGEETLLEMLHDFLNVKKVYIHPPRKPVRAALPEASHW